MGEASCRRELELEIPAEDVQRATERVAKEFARIARIPGFRPGKAPVTLILRRFAEEIKGEVLESLLPGKIEQAAAEQKLTPVTRPQVDKVDFTEAGPLKFRASFEVLPEFELGEYKYLEVEVDGGEVSDADVDKSLEEMRERAATYAPVEGRAVANGDFAQIKIMGSPTGGGEPVRADNVMCHIGAEETLEEFTTQLRGANVGERREIDVKYPDDYPDPKLASKAYHYSVEVMGIKEKKLAELNDEFAKEVSETGTLEELRGKIRQSLEAARDHQQEEQARERVLAKLVETHDFPVPESLVEQQMDVRLERVVRSLAAQGVDPRAVNVDWVALRRRQQERAAQDVKAELLLDRVATAENIDATDEELEKEIAIIAERGGESATAARARLTKAGALDRMKSKLRSDKALEWLRQNARIRTTAEAKR